MRKIKVALLHLLLVAGDLKHNQSLIEKAVKEAARKGADLIITPELATSGLQFTNIIGENWIEHQPNEWMVKFSNFVKSNNTTVFLGCAERSAEGKLHNSVFVIDKKGRLLGKQKKITRVDHWSSPGESVEAIDLGYIKVGVLICADAYPKTIASTLAKKGAEILVAPSSWGPGLHGPEGEWEERSIETGLPIFVCNRTGEDKTVVFWDAESSVIKNGERLLSHKSSYSALLMFDWNLDKMDVMNSKFEVLAL
ncbi:carbon-nitrogen hydrolase family protein [Anaerobacillus alkalidiazotrophicus]|uniref:Carbon-nitrogen hydrolase family protein n=1 Tax=Anaerobacillus alkalidiazotrophicus TaxID=472963 RepID=A0A1S2M6K2_9BACI|nr:carbon-nitrogen hydrolase family protein [Anaerobacillus alkalidiazotrophicus]OIJ19407.1 carbon-nitrogen hydrolase family protein [Anaerobacillus alkalidiazotrophicus]